VRTRVAAAAFVLLVHLGLLWIYWRPQPKVLLGDEARYRAWADEILSGRDPEPDLLWPPLYPRFLALVLGSPQGSLLRVQLVQTALLIFVAFVLRDLVRRLTGRLLAADAAAWLVLAYPPLVAFAHYLWPEVLHQALFLGALWILLARPASLAWMPVAGILLGLALLTKSLLGPFLPVLLWPVLREGPWPRRLARAGLLLAVLGATVLPTMVANRSRAGRFVIADSSRFNLWVGLNDRSRKSLVDDRVGEEYAAYHDSAPTFAERDAILAERTAALVRERGILATLGGQLSRQYFRLFDKDSYLSDQLPDGPVGRTGNGYQGTAPALVLLVRAVSYVLYAFVLVGFAFGLVLCPPRDRPGLWVVLAFLAYNLAIFLLLHVKSRYQLQLLPFVFLYAGCALDGTRPRGEPSDPAAGVYALAFRVPLLAIGGAALLLFLAFGGGWI
jgi:4-amino-4-deoxy-L-arabinose transferase-like glycosyltransferase